MAICADYAAESINRLPLAIVTQNIALEMRLLLRWSRLTDAPIFRLLLYYYFRSITEEKYSVIPD